MPRTKPAPPPAAPAPKSKPRPAEDPQPAPAHYDDRPSRRPPPPREQPKNTLPVVLGFGGGLVAIGLAVAVALLITAVTKKDKPPPADGDTATRPDPQLTLNPPQGQGPPLQPGPGVPPPEQDPPPDGWSAFQGEGFRVHVPTGSDFRHDPRPNEVPVFGEREKVWTSHKTATPGQPEYGVSVVQMARDDQDEYKRKPDPMWERIVRVAGGLPAAKYTFQKEVTARGTDAREYTFLIGGTLHGLVRFAVRPEAGQVFAWSVLSRDPVTGDEPLVKPFLDSFAIDRPAPPPVPATDEWKEVAGDGFTIKVPAADDLFTRKGNLFAKEWNTKSTKWWTTIDGKKPPRHQLTLDVSVSELDVRLVRELASKPDVAWGTLLAQVGEWVENDATFTPTLTETTLDGRKGRQMVFRFEGVVSTHRCVVHDGKLYVVNLKRRPAESEEPVKKCFDSFKITP